VATFIFTFQPGTVATISKSQGKWYVDAVNTADIVISVEDTDGNGLLSDTEWNAATGGDGNDIGGAGYLFAGGGTSGTLYSTSGIDVFTIGDDVSSIRAGLSNNYETDVSGIVCFTPNTMIATPLGSRAIETLKAGDLVITADNGLQPIRWIGRKQVTGARLFAKPDLKPIKICKGALGNNLPDCDTWVSPQHRMRLQTEKSSLLLAEPEILVAAKSLVNNQTILVDHTVKAVEYIHILFDKHELVFANGSLSESFYPGISALTALDKPVQNEVFEIFPELANFPNTYGTLARPNAIQPEAALLSHMLIEQDA